MRIEVEKRIPKNNLSGFSSEPVSVVVGGVPANISRMSGGSRAIALTVELAARGATEDLVLVLDEAEALAVANALLIEARDRAGRHDYDVGRVVPVR